MPIQASKTLSLALVLLLTASLAAQPAQAVAESEPNDSCATADLTYDGSSNSGYMSEFDNDFFKLWIEEGSSMSISMFQPNDPGVEFNLVLYTPGCVIADFNYAPGYPGEHIYYTATATGYWYIEIWTQMGTGYYTGPWLVKSAGTETCSAQAGSLGYAECSLSSHECPSVCDYTFTLSVSGIGVVDGAIADPFYGPILSCTGINHCSASTPGWPSSYGLICSTGLLHATILTSTITCSLTSEVA